MHLLNRLGRSTALAKTIGELGINTGEFLYWYGHAQASIIVLGDIARVRVLDHLGDAPRSAAEMAR